MPERSTIDEEDRCQRGAASSTNRAVRATRVRSHTVVEMISFGGVNIGVGRFWESEADVSSPEVE